MVKPHAKPPYSLFDSACFPGSILFDHETDYKFSHRRVIIANRENEDRMRMIGYNPVAYRTVAFVISSVFAGLAGMLYSIWNTSASPNMTLAVMTVDALIMTILGGWEHSLVLSLAQA